MLGTHLVNHLLKPFVRNETTLHVIGVISNPCRYQARYRLAREWLKAMEATSHVQVYLVETAFGDRFHEIREEMNPRHLGLRNQSPIWIKESMINLGVKYLLPRSWQYLAWVDCDVFFKNPNWALDTLHELQHRPIIQPWQDCIDLGPRGEILEVHRSFGYIIANHIRRQRKPGEPYRFGHPGFAWATRRDFWEATQGLMDFAILGSGDHHMATALVNEVDTSVHNRMSSGFKRKCHEWQKKAFRACQGNVGYLPNIIEHRFHGSKKKRYYRERWEILVQHGYDPYEHLSYDSQGLVKLLNQEPLERAIHDYNLSREEDSIDV